jgi:hypothetical protein
VHYVISEPLIFGLCDLACGKPVNGKS